MEAIEASLKRLGPQSQPHCPLVEPFVSSLCHRHCCTPFAVASKGWEKALTSPSQVQDAASHA